MEIRDDDGIGGNDINTSVDFEVSRLRGVLGNTG